MISFNFQTSLKISYKHCSFGNMWVGELKKKIQEGLYCRCKVSHQERWKNWQCAIWNDQVIRDDTDTKSPDTGNKPEWYQRAEHEPDLICQWDALILTTSWQNCHISWNSVWKLAVTKNSKQSYFHKLCTLGFSYNESSATRRKEVSQFPRNHLCKALIPRQINIIWHSYF